MVISSNALFHFTNSLDRICSILKNGFQASYCMESKVLNTEYAIGAIPMISFCDLPLSQISNHISNYGEYGIGMKKNWGIENKLNPVLYLDSSSYITKDFFTAFTKMADLIYQQDAKEKEKLKEYYTPFITFLGNLDRFSKNYSGELKRDGIIINDSYKFYDEREWRYVPEFFAPNMKPRLSPTEYAEYKLSNPNKPQLPNIRLCFDSNDIKYLIVKTESDIPKLINYIFNDLNIGSQEDIKILTTRIFTSDQIREDI